MKNEAAYTDYVKTPIGLLLVDATDDGVRAVNFVEKKTKPVMVNVWTQRCIEQLQQYFASERRDFDLPLQTLGTQFQRQVWRQLCRIGYGVTASYGDIAKSIGNPAAVRAVGAANGKNPLAIIVPCHRIIGSNGTLTGYAGGLQRKEWLLKHEGALLL